MAKKDIFTHPGTFYGMNPQLLIGWLTPHRAYLEKRGFSVPEADMVGPINYEQLEGVTKAKV